MSAPDTLTLADLRTRTFPHPSLGVLGDPIAHSLSPAMHNAALAALRPTHPTLVSLHYLRLHITAAELPAALLSLRELGFAGLNSVSYTHLRAHETSLHLVCRLLLEKKNR